MKTIIEMARVAGVRDDGHRFEFSEYKYLERFAELVRADEREAWEHKYARLQSLMEIRETQPNKPCCLSEREACAKVADKYANGLERNYSEIIADLIRARGNT